MSSALLFFLIFLAGFVDSIAGGGGLISLAAYYAFGLGPLAALSNNKFSSTFGTIFSTLNYARNKSIDFTSMLPGIFSALLGSFIGSYLAVFFSDYYFRIFLLLAIPLLTILALRKKTEKERRFDRKKELMLVSIFSFIIGCYDGFFGPGTGTFLTLAFSFIGFSLLESAANSKVINLTSNVIALSVFLSNGSVDLGLGIKCALFSIFGNILGSSLAIKLDKKIIKPILLAVLALLYIEVLNIF